MSRPKVIDFEQWRRKKAGKAIDPVERERRKLDQEQRKRAIAAILKDAEKLKW